MHLTAATAASMRPGTRYNIVTQLYKAPSDSNTFEPINGTKFYLIPQIDGRVQHGQKFNGGFEGHDIKVYAGEQILTVVYLEGEGRNTGVLTFLGYASGGIDIA